MKTPTPEFHRPTRIADLADGENSIEIAADATERQALARRFALVGLDRLEARLTLVPADDRRGLDVEGRLIADVVQSCVVTLDPVRATIDAVFRRAYAVEPPPEDDGDLGPSLLDAVDPPDPIVDGTVDLGEAVAEELALELDPFPRADGVAFEKFSEKLNKSKEIEDKSHPFAVLADLKRKR